MAGKSDFQTVNTKIVVDPTGVKPGLDKAESSLKSFATNAKHQLHGLNLGAIADPLGLGALESRFGSVLGSIGKFASSPLGMVTGLTAGFLGVSEAAHHFMLEQSKSLVQLDKSAMRLGMTRRERGGFDALFGKEGGENAAHAFIKMNKLIGDAALGSDEARKKLGHFGITVEDALGRSQTHNIEAFAKAIAAVPDPARRTAMAIELLGKAGGEYMPEIMKIAKGGLSAAQDFAADIGYSGTDDMLELARHEIEKQRRKQMMFDAAMRKSALLGHTIEFMAAPVDKITQTVAEGVVSNSSWFDDLFGKGDVSRQEWEKQQQKFIDAQKGAEAQKAAIQQYKADQRTNFIEDMENQITVIEKLNDRFGMTAEQIAIFNFQEKLAGDNALDAAEKMTLLDRFTKAVGQQSENALMAKFSNPDSFASLQRSLGLSPTFRDIAGASVTGSVGSEQAIQNAMYTRTKSETEQWTEAIRENNKKQDEQLRYQQRWENFYRKNMTILMPARLLN